MKIADDMTIGRLAVELAKLGVEYTFQRIAPHSTRPYLVVVGRVGLECADTGMTYAQALDGAVARFIHRMARRDLAGEADS